MKNENENNRHGKEGEIRIYIKDKGVENKAIYYNFLSMLSFDSSSRPQRFRRSSMAVPLVFFWGYRK